MEATYSIEGMTCDGCVATVRRSLSGVDGIRQVEVSLDKGKVIVVADKDVPLQKLQHALHGSHYRLMVPGRVAVDNNTGFWQDQPIWRRSSLNTLNCLVGCSIGDFGMIIYLQAFYPGTSMNVQMVLAVIAGLITSVLLETSLLRFNEKFSWSLALKTALSMSFLSMVAMEVVMNATDFMLTGGKAAFANPVYWLALGVSMIAGFLAPLPYNYYKLKKHGMACH